MSRPSSFTQEIADEICEHIASGKSLVSYCKQEGKPGYSTVTAWLASNLEFQAKYARAREDQADYLAEEIIEIADDESGDYRTKDGEETLFLRPENIQRAKLRVDTRKWIASKMKPKKYGDKQQVDLGGQADNPLVVEHDIGPIGAHIERLLK